MIIVYSILLLLFSWVFWTVAHEISHFLALKSVRNVSYWKIDLVPRIIQNNIQWARINMVREGEPLNSNETALVYLAPRIMNLVASIMIVFSFLLSGDLLIYWLLFWGAGLVDFFVGSLGVSPKSDLQIASKAINWNPNIIRFIGFIIILISLFTTVMLLLM
jgi:hypothetical protein